MIGVDTSVRPATWAAWTDTAWLAGSLPDGSAMPAALRAAVTAHHLHAREIALCIGTSGVAIDRIAGALSAARVRKAARLAAASTFKIAPGDIVTSVDRDGSGATYVAAPRPALEDRIAPWREAGFRVAVIEPAAITLLRGAATETVQIIVRMGLDLMELVVGSSARFIQARQVDLGGDARIERIRLEIETTISDVRATGSDVAGVLVCDPTVAGQLAQHPGHLPPVAPYRIGAVYRTTEPPADAAAAAGAALWRRRPAAGPTPRTPSAPAERTLRSGPAAWRHWRISKRRVPVA